MSERVEIVDELPSSPQHFTFTISKLLNEKPVLVWSQNSEPDVDSYNVYRQSKSKWDGRVVAKKIATEWRSTRFIDEDFSGSPYYETSYFVTALNKIGQESQASNIELRGGNDSLRSESSSDFLSALKSNPTVFELAQNYPNPFNPETQIPFALPEMAHVRIAIFDLTGREIKTVTDDNWAAGYHTLRWNGLAAEGQKVGTGVYLCNISALGESGRRFRQTIKLLFIK
jgi:hypothetical protein